MENTGHSELKDYSSMKQEIIDAVCQFVISIDKPGAVLALYDEGKVYARDQLYDYPTYYKAMVDYIIANTQHLKIRVGGYSYRIENLLFNMIRVNPILSDRIEFVQDLVKPFDLRSDRNLMNLADGYDFKGFDGHTCVYYYENDIESGFTGNDGSFHPFYQAKSKGYEAVCDVIMAIGYKDIPAATAAVHTYSSDYSGDMICIGGKATQKKCRGKSRQDLFDRFGIPYLDISKLFPGREELREIVDEERRRKRVPEIPILTFGDYLLYKRGNIYQIEFVIGALTTPKSHLIRTSYQFVAESILKEFYEQGYNAHQHPINVMHYHFYLLDNYKTRQKADIAEKLIGKLDNDWFISKFELLQDHMDLYLRSLVEHGNSISLLNRVKHWLSQCSHMQLAAASCLASACGSICIAYLMAVCVEILGEDGGMVKTLCSLIAIGGTPQDASYWEEVLIAFAGYYRIHYDEDGVKV